MVAAPSQDATPVGTEYRAQHPIPMLEGAERFVLADVPQPRGVVGTPGQDAAVVGTEYRAVDQTVMQEGAVYME